MKMRNKSVVLSVKNVFVLKFSCVLAVFLLYI